MGRRIRKALQYDCTLPGDIPPTYELLACRGSVNLKLGRQDKGRGLYHAAAEAALAARSSELANKYYTLAGEMEEERDASLASTSDRGGHGGGPGGSINLFAFIV